MTSHPSEHGPGSPHDDSPDRDGAAWADLVGAVYTLEEAAERTGLPADTLARAVRVLTTLDGHTVVPAWVFTADMVIDSRIQQIVSVLASAAADNWTIAQWIRARHRALDGLNVLDYLAIGGDLTGVLQSAKRAAAAWQRERTTKSRSRGSGRRPLQSSSRLSRTWRGESSLTRTSTRCDRK